MRKTVLILALFCLMGGCGKNTNNARTEDMLAAYAVRSPELVEIDSQLDELDENTRKLEETYDGIQTAVLQNVDFKGSDTDNGEGISVYINDNSVLIVNNKIMSRNDFIIFADKNLPRMCSPSPRLSMHKKANYDTAAWVLEQIYAHGCTNVEQE